MANYKNQWYKASDKETIGGYKAIKNRTNGELVLIGHYGEIFQIDEKTFGAIIHSARVAKKYLPESKHPVQAGDEVLIRFSIDELPLWIKRLKVTRNREGMIEMSDWSAFAGDDEK